MSDTCPVFREYAEDHMELGYPIRVIPHPCRIVGEHDTHTDGKYQWHTPPAPSFPDWVPYDIDPSPTVV